MATQEPVEITDPEILDSIDRLANDPSYGVRRERPQHHDEPNGEHDVVEDPDSTTEEVDPLILAFKKERLAKELTQWDVARLMGLASGSQVSRLEAGESDIQLSTLRTWAKALDLDIQARTLVRRGRPKNNFR